MLSLFVSCLIVRGQYVSCSTDTCLKCRTLARPKMRCENDRCNKNLYEWNEEIVCRTHCTYGPNGAEREKKDKQNERTNEKKNWKNSWRSRLSFVVVALCDKEFSLVFIFRFRFFFFFFFVVVEQLILIWSRRNKSAARWFSCFSFCVPTNEIEPKDPDRSMENSFEVEWIEKLQRERERNAERDG